MLPALYRKRFIPDELVLLNNDVIEHIGDGIIITAWTALKPRKDFSGGRSVYFIDEGFKLTRFYDGDTAVPFIYCDIIQTVYDKDNNAYTFMDLLADVLVYDNGYVKILDLDELAEALDKQLISPAQTKLALQYLDGLLKIVYSGRFDEYSVKLVS